MRTPVKQLIVHNLQTCKYALGQPVIPAVDILGPKKVMSIADVTEEGLIVTRI